jgi:hypothetical protein
VRIGGAGSALVGTSSNVFQSLGLAFSGFGSQTSSSLESSLSAPSLRPTF